MNKDMEQALHYQIETLLTLDCFEEDHPHVMAGEEIYKYIISQPGTMTRSEAGWSIEGTYFESIEDMFEGASAMFLNIRWHRTRFLADDKIMPKKDFDKKN